MNLEDRIKYLQEKGRTRKRKRQWYKKWWGVLLVVLLYFVAIFSVAFAFLMGKIIFSPTFREQYILLNRSSDVNREVENSELAAMRLRIIEGEDSPQIGNPDADITIVVFSDFTCPYCKEEAEVIASLSVKYGKDIKIISREFAVVGEDSVTLATAALCAKDQNRYWPMYYKLFELQGQFALSDLASIARLAGVSDLKLFSDCLNSDKYYNYIVQSMADGQFLEIKGTPAWFINGEKITEGFIPFNLLSQLLDKFLLSKNIEN